MRQLVASKRAQTQATLLQQAELLMAKIQAEAPLQQQAAQQQAAGQTPYRPGQATSATYVPGQAVGPTTELAPPQVLSASQLAVLGWQQVTDPVTGRSYWYHGPSGISFNEVNEKGQVVFA